MKQTITHTKRFFLGFLFLMFAGLYINAQSDFQLVLNSEEDTYLNLNDVNYSLDSTLNVYTYPSVSPANVILIKFDVSSIPANAIVDSASLDLYCTTALDKDDRTTYDVPLHSILFFDPDLTLATGVTYDGTNEWTPNDMAAYDKPLAQADLSPAYDIQHVDQTLGWKHWDMTVLLQEWINMPYSNFGIALNSDGTAAQDSRRYFASMENVETARHPTLTINYQVDADTTTAVENNLSDLNNRLNISANADICIIRRSDSSSSMTYGNKLNIYNISGKMVEQINENDGEFIWNTSAVCNGIYLMKLVGSQYYPGQKFVLIK